MVDYSLEAGEKTRIGPNCTCRFWEIKVPPDSRPNPGAWLISLQVQIFASLPAGDEASLFGLPDWNYNFVRRNKLEQSASGGLPASSVVVEG